MTTMTPPTADVIETAARWAVTQSGWIQRVLDGHTERCDVGHCAGCGTYRPTRWPCVLVVIAHRAQQLEREFIQPEETA